MIFSQEIILVSAGFDAHREDDIASLQVASGYAWVAADQQVAAASAHGRIVSMLEGGYALSALGRSVAAHLRVLADV